MHGDISIFYHPGGGKHEGLYHGISSGATGKIKVVNPETYIPLKGDKATIIYDWGDNIDIIRRKIWKL